MNIEIIEILMNLFIIDINLLIIAKGMQCGKLDDERTNKFTKLIFSEYKKNTKIHLYTLVCNLVFVLVNVIYSFIKYIRSGIEFSQAIVNICNQIVNGWKEILICGALIIFLTAVFFVVTYRAVQIEPIKSDVDGNLHLTAKEIDEAYINFSKPDCIDGRSILMLIAGDLSFLGNIPTIKDIRDKRKRKMCKQYLSENSLSFRCKKKCPSNIKKCIEKSRQFAQLFDLNNKEITLHVICQQPKYKSDIPYKRRLGRLIEIFSNNIEIRFLPKDTLGSEICVLGRIKVNGGIQELFWHWKDPNKPGTYTVPNTRKADSSENKTLIYLLGTMLWNSADKMSEDMIKECIDEYNKAIENIGENVKENVSENKEESVREDVEENDKENLEESVKEGVEENWGE